MTALTTIAPSALIEKAIESDAGVDKLERLMDMQLRWEAEQAKKEFQAALTQFQNKCPVIDKKKNGHNYKYAPLCDIVSQIKNLLSECGLSYRFEQEHSEGKYKVTCVVTHVDGHSEYTSMEAYPDNTGSKNDVQAIGSTVTYLQRYTLTGALGITTADEDMDGRIGNEINWIQYMECIRENFDTISDIKLAVANNEPADAKDHWSDLEREDQMLLWVAPTKGGIFTIEERKAIKEGK